MKVALKPTKDLEFQGEIHPTTLLAVTSKTSMAEQMPVDGAVKDDMQKAPAEQAQDKKNGAPEKLKVDSSDSSSGPEKDLAKGDDSSNGEKNKKMAAKENDEKAASGEKKLLGDSSDSDSGDSASASASASSSDDDSVSDSASDSDSDSDSGKSSSEAVKKDKKKKKKRKGLTEQIKGKLSKKSEEGVEVPEKALDMLECKSNDSASGSESGDDSGGDSKSGQLMKDDKSKSKEKKKKKEVLEKAQAEPSEGTGEDTSPVAGERTMEVAETRKGKGKRIGPQEQAQGP